MKEPRKAAKEGGDSDAMRTMRERYDALVDIERSNRILGEDDYRFVAVPGNQWDAAQKKARRNRPCNEFPLMRAHWRQVVNDQKKARPGIKVRAVSDATTDGAELRQGIIRGIESQSKASLAYDSAFEVATAAGMLCWRVKTDYTDTDAWDQDFVIEPIKDALNSVWMAEDGSHGFVEETISREAFKKRYPKAEVVDFDSAQGKVCSGWFGKDDVRIAEYWRLEPVTKTICLLSDGRSIDAEQLAGIQDELDAQGITCVRQRQAESHKVICSIVSGLEELTEPKESVFHKIPIILKYANRHYVDGKWNWMGMVRASRDSQKLVNYSFTSAAEMLAKQHKNTPLVTPKMLEGDGVKGLWDASNAVDLPYLPYTPDPTAPGLKPDYLQAPPIHAAFAQFGQIALDLLKASDGIYDASVGARSNETSGKAILARQHEGDTATYDYQDLLAEGIQETGELIGRALPKVYDTPRVVRVVGKDGAETWEHLYQEVVDQQTGRKTVLNDLSAGKYDYTVTTGPSYDTQRMEFVDALVQLSQGNEMIASAVPDLIVGSMDFPKAEEAAERLKALLPPPIQQTLNKNGPSPEVLQMQQAMQMQQQQAQEVMGEMHKQLQQAQAKAQSKDDAILREINAAKDREVEAKKLDIEHYKAVTERMALGVDVMSAEREFALDATQALHDAEMDHAAHQQQAEQFDATQQQNADQFQAQQQQAPE